jgi:hypothetical protein
MVLELKGGKMTPFTKVTFLRGKNMGMENFLGLIKRPMRESSL